jgi:cytochrome c-type biogenesis protein CcmE
MNGPRLAAAAPRRGAAPASENPGEQPASAAASAPDRTRHGAPDRVAGRSRWRLGVVLVVLAGAFASLLALGLRGSLNYFETVDQAVAHRATLGATTFRLEGVVVPGSIHRTNNGVDFVVSGARHRVAVVNHGSPPQLFQPAIPVVVLGHFVNLTFVSQQVIVDHSSQYVEQHPDRVKAPNGTVR